jgi:molybdenum cofactor synthesis domain-containing protein
MKYKAAVITLSDRAYKKVYEDKSGKVLKELLEKHGFEVVDYDVLPDEKDLLRNKILCLRKEKIDLIITTGGTGLTSRDITPEVTYQIIDRRMEFMEMAIFLANFKVTPKAMLSRGVCGVIGRTIILNFPGSPNAVITSFNAVKDVLDHAIKKVNDDSSEP